MAGRPASQRSISVVFPLREPKPFRAPQARFRVLCNDPRIRLRDRRKSPFPRDAVASGSLPRCRRSKYECHPAECLVSNIWHPMPKMPTTCPCPARGQGCRSYRERRFWDVAYRSESSDGPLLRCCVREGRKINMTACWSSQVNGGVKVASGKIV